MISIARRPSRGLLHLFLVVKNFSTLEFFFHFIPLIPFNEKSFYKYGNLKWIYLQRSQSIYYLLKPNKQAMRNTNRGEQNRSSNQSWNQPWSNRNRGSQQRFMNEGNSGRNNPNEQRFEQEEDYDQDNYGQERQQGNRGYGGSESEGEYSGRQFRRDSGREYRGESSRENSGSGRGYDWGESTGGSGRGYGNDPESFASSYGRTNYGNTGRGYYGDAFETTSYGGSRGNYGAGEGYGGGRGQIFNSGFGRSWNRDEDMYGETRNRGQQQFGQGQQQSGQSSMWGGQESHRGKGPKGYQRSDERIRDEINDKLTDDDRIDASEIEVRVERGEVTLTGTVQERNLKRIAEDIVESISGVKNVENRIRVGTGVEESSKATGTATPGATTKSNDRSKIRESVS
jgi:hypothetical protein